MTTVIESDVEEAALGWLTAYGPGIGPDSPRAERDNYGQAVLERQLRDALARLNPSLSVSALHDALGKLTQPEGATLEARNRSFDRMLVNGVAVEYQAGDDSIRGEQAPVVDFHAPETNDWPAVNQFTVTENPNTHRPDIVLFEVDPEFRTGGEVRVPLLN